ncbi:hypothetical protein ACFLYU_00120 [Candidatus Dependentiae bacterium]
MKKFICTKLLVALTINLLAMPLANGGKKRYKRRYDKGKNYRRKERRFNYSGRVSKKEKRRKSKWQQSINIEKLSKTNRARNKNWPEIQKKARQEYLLKKHKKCIEYRKDTKKFETSRGLSFGKFMMPKFSRFFIMILLFVNVFAQQHEIETNIYRDGRLVCNTYTTYVVWKDPETGEIEDFGYPQKCGVTKEECITDTYYIKLIDDYGKLDYYTTCYCEVKSDLGYQLHCEIPRNTHASTSALSTTSNIFSTVTSTLIASGCALTGLFGGLYCLGNKIIKKMRLKSKKELSNSKIVKVEEKTGTDNALRQALVFHLRQGYDGQVVKTTTGRQDETTDTDTDNERVIEISDSDQYENSETSTEVETTEVEDESDSE